MPLGVAQVSLGVPWGIGTVVIRGFMPLGVAQLRRRLTTGSRLHVIRGFMPLGVAQGRLHFYLLVNLS